MIQERPGEHQNQPESVGGQEILDFKNHGAVYGRFLLASLPGAATANIIDPNQKVEFENLTLDTLEKKNYNPVAKDFSLEERKERWKNVEYLAAYSQWRTEFTGFMTKIKAGSIRESALGVIMSDPNAKAAEFTEEKADKLFGKFCKDMNNKDTSNIDAFVKSVTKNLVTDEKIDPTKLRGLLPELQWIASGLFGKETASSIVTRLIELESALHNDTQKVLNLFNFNKDRINNPGEDEKKIFGVLHPYLIPQEKVPGTTQEIKSAPVTEPGKDKEAELEIKPPPTRKSSQLESPVVPSIETAPSTQGKSRSTAEIIQKLQSQLDTLEKSPTEIGEYTKRYIDDQKETINTQIKGLERIDELKIEIGNLEQIDTSKFGEYTKQDIILRQERLKKELANLEAKYAPPPPPTETLPEPEKDLAGMNVKETKAVQTEPSGAKGAGKAGENVVDISHGEPKNGGEAARPTDDSITVTESAINMEGIEPTDIPKEFNKLLEENKNKPHITLSFSPDQLKEYITSVAGDKVQGGEIKVGKNNQIIIEKIQINMPVGGKVTLDLIIENDYVLDRIVGHIQNYKGNLITNRLRGKVEDRIKGIDDAVKEYLRQMMVKDNLGWWAGKISISDGKVLVRFEKILLPLDS